MSTTRTPRKPLPGRSLADLHPHLAKEWDEARNGKPASTTFPASSARAWWVCSTCRYEWLATAGNRTRGGGCPNCLGRVLVPGMNDFGSRFPQPAAEWHPTRNGDVTPADVFAKSNTRYWFSCRKCGHEWMIDPASRARGRGCGACSGQVIVAGLNDLATVRPDVAAEWHPTKNGSLTPAQVTVRSETRPWWKCSRCGHEWATRVMHRTDNHGCSRCAEYGFDLASPAIVYFITHRTLGAHKVGITTYDTERLGKFTRAGWTLLHLEHVATGADAVSIETEVHRWWRDDLELPAWLTREQMRGTHGHTETISADELSEFEVISRIKQEAGRVRAAREAGLADAA